MARVTTEENRLNDHIRRLEDEKKTRTTRYLTYTTADAGGKCSIVRSEHLVEYLTKRERASGGILKIYWHLIEQVLDEIPEENRPRSMYD
jgi:hypothetical protein